MHGLWSIEQWMQTNQKIKKSICFFLNGAIMNHLNRVYEKKDLETMGFQAG